MPDHRSVFFVSDGTGITAETFGNSILAQFSMRPRHVRRPFIDSGEKAQQVVREINETAEREGKRPIVFTTLVSAEVLGIVAGPDCRGLVLDMFKTFVEPLEAEFGDQEQPPRRPLLRCSEEPRVRRPHRGDQLLRSPTTMARARATSRRPT